MHLRTAAATALLVFALTGAAVAQQPPAAGAAPAAPAAAAPMAPPAVLANACGACHGTDGKGAPNSVMPKINGRPAAELATILKGFKADQPVVTVMNRISKGYSDAEIDAIAQHFSAIR